MKKPGVPNQANISSGIDQDNLENPLDSIINNPKGKVGDGMDTSGNSMHAKVSSFVIKAVQGGNEGLDKEMQDESK